jgi:hypothetical protein
VFEDELYAGGQRKARLFRVVWPDAAPSAEREASGKAEAKSK